MECLKQRNEGILNVCWVATECIKEVEILLRSQSCGPQLDIDSGFLALASAAPACALCVYLAAIEGASSLLRSRVLSLLCAPGHRISISCCVADYQLAFARFATRLGKVEMTERRNVLTASEE